MKAYMPDNAFREELGSEEVVEDLSREQCLEAYRIVEEGILEIEEKLHKVIAMNQLRKEVVPQFIQI